MRPSRLFCFLLMIVFVSACGTAGSSSKFPRPDVAINPLGTPFFGSGTEAPVDIEVVITNRAQEPIRVRSIRITSPGMVQWALVSQNRIFNETIAPGTTKSLSIPATAVASSSRLNPTEPLAARVEVRFEAASGSHREVYNFQNIVL
jgi:hypothetical protein